MRVLRIDSALHAGDFLHSLMEITKVHDFASLLTNSLDSSYEQCCDVAGTDSVLRNIESYLLFKHAQVINDLEKEIDDDPEHACCSCECLRQRESVTRVKRRTHSKSASLQGAPVVCIGSYICPLRLVHYPALDRYCIAFAH